LEWISAAEGSRFAEIMRGLEEMRQRVTPEEIEQTRKIIAEHRIGKKGEIKS
jgi:heterodisulfide reductase subunit A